MNNIFQIPLSQLRPNPYQPPGRLTMSEEKARKGGESLLRSGLIQVPVGRGTDGVYEIGDGWQRKLWHEWLVKNGHKEFDTMPIDLRELTDEQMADLIEETDENKANMTVFDRAWLWKKRLADFPKTTQKQFAERRGMSQGELSNTIRLLDLPEKVQQMIISHEITESHGRALLALKEPGVITNYAVLTKEQTYSVAALTMEIQRYLDKQKPQLGNGLAAAAAANGAEVTVVDFKVELETGVGEADPGQPMDEEDQETFQEQPEQEAGDAQAGLKPGTAGAVQKNNRGSANKDAKSAPAKTPPAPAKPVAPAAVKPKWKRKLVIEEKKETVMVSYGKVGEIPQFLNIPGTLEDLWEEKLNTFMDKVNAEWLNAETKLGIKEVK